jgi:hypothetical protein
MAPGNALETDDQPVAEGAPRQIASQRDDSGAADTDRAEIGSPEHKTTISEPAGDTTKASQSLSAPHRECSRPF